MKIINLLTLIAPLCVLADLTDHEASEGGMFGRIAQVQISSPKDVGQHFQMVHRPTRRLVRMLWSTMRVMG